MARLLAAHGKKNKKNWTSISRFCVVFIGLGVTQKWFYIFIALRAPEHRETIVFLKVEEHNFHLVLIRSNSIKISRSWVSLGPHSVHIFWDPKKSSFFDLKIFHFHTIFNEKFRFFSISKNFEKLFSDFFRKFLRSKIFIEIV